MTQILHFLPSAGTDKTAVCAFIYLKMPQNFTYSAFFLFLLFSHGNTRLLYYSQSRNDFF